MTPVKISILATPETSPSTLFGLFDILSSVGIGWETFVTNEDTQPRFDVRIVGTEGKPIVCSGSSSGLVVTPHLRADDQDDADVAIVASFVAKSRLDFRENHPKELAWLKYHKQKGSVLAAACTGTILFAEAGLLDGCEATTLWIYKDLAPTRYPKVRWKLDQNLCLAGDEDQIITAGGATVWQELAVYLINRYFGAVQASYATKLWMIPSRFEGQTPYTPARSLYPHDDALINECQSWALENSDISNPVAEMIKLSGLSAGAFTRRFKRATGNNPLDFVHMLRLERAKSLLEEADISVIDIANIVGYEDTTAFRRIFKRKVGLTPSNYRRSFGVGRLAVVTD